MKVKAPRKAFINGKSFTMKRGALPKDNGSEAIIYFHDYIIKFRKGLHPISECVAVLHETMHDAITEERVRDPDKFKLSEQLEERIVDILDDAIYLFIVENPQYIKYITQESGRGK